MDSATFPCDRRDPPLIGLTGPAGCSGKDTVATHLGARHGFVRVVLADPIRDMVYELDPLLATGLSVRMLVDRVGWEAAKRHRLHGPEVRRLLQVFGTEVGRAMISTTLWIDLSERHCRELLDGGVPVVVTDVRFPDEAAMIRRLRGTVVRVHRPGCDAAPAGPTAGHASETETANVVTDLTLHNGSTVEALTMACSRLVEQLRLRADNAAEDRTDTVKDLSTA